MPSKRPALPSSRRVRRIRPLILILILILILVLKSVAIFVLVLVLVLIIVFVAIFVFVLLLVFAVARLMPRADLVLLLVSLDMREEVHTVSCK